MKKSDAFEFYMFHFAYYLVGSNNNSKWSTTWASLNDALFPVLLEDYLREFLPCDASVPPGPPNPPVSPRGVLNPLVHRYCLFECLKFFVFIN